MTGRSWRLLLLSIAALHSSGVSAFRSCDMEDSFAYVATTQYTIAEITFEATTGIASGTETIYNHSNDAIDGHLECHVTYELSGSYEPASGTLVLDAHRSNHSISCPAELIAAGYPQERLYALLIELEREGGMRVSLADSGEQIAEGEWSQGATAYRTKETCTAF